MDHDLRKLKDQAALWTAKEKYSKALEAYAELARLEPENARWPQKAGEIHRKMGRIEAAVSSLGEAAHRFAEGGFLVKAVALCKVILEIDPRHVETQSMLARLYSARAGSAPTVRPPAAPPPTMTVDLDLGAEAPSPPAIPPAPTSSPGREPRSARRTIPPGASLDAATLSVLVPGARPHERDEGTGRVFEIPLDEPEITIDLSPIPLVAPPASPSGAILRRPLTPLFSSLDEGALHTLIGKVALRNFGPGEKIVRQGEDGDSLYVVVDGEVVVYQEGEPRLEVNRLADGAFFGEIALLTHLPRSASVEAASETSVLEISRQTMSELLDEHPEVLTVLLRFFRSRLVETLVATSELFAPFTNDERRDLASRFAFIEAEPGTEIIREGRPADNLYLLLCGTVDVSQWKESTIHHLGELGPGGVLGEISLLGGGPAAATIFTRTKCWLLALDRRTFREVIMTHPQVLAYLSELAGKRLGQDAFRSGAPAHDERRLPLL